MLSMPDFREKQVLFIRAERGLENNLRFLNDNIVFSKDGQVINRASCHRVFAAFIIGDITITSGLMRQSARRGLSLIFLKNNLETYASINAQAEGHVVLRQRQYAFTDGDALGRAKQLIANKIGNQCALLKERKMSEGLLAEEEGYLNTVEGCTDAASLRGIEGAASRLFFQEYFKDLGWRRRGPRTKEDIPNLLLDLGYSMMFHCTASLLRLHGFDVFKGFYHTLFFQRQSLVCDLMEPMRCLIDRELLKMHNLKRISEKDFEVRKGQYLLPWANSSKYVEIFLNVIMDNKDGIYRYVHDYYRNVLTEGDNEFPTFRIGL